MTPQDAAGRVARAIDRAIARDFDGAKTLLSKGEDDGVIAGRLMQLIADIERRENQRRVETADIRHELGNALAIARANLEGVADGVLPATPKRIEGIIETLASSGELLERLRGLCEP